ncbi:S8 family serine peptidase [Sphingomonas sp. KR3-1]|uniref:S8 family peptidase n=1 Tax=Sphingomonas sp. KR3-1 TaxID=3156611 RepID=UPI0032B5B5C1
MPEYSVLSVPKAEAPATLDFAVESVGQPATPKLDRQTLTPFEAVVIEQQEEVQVVARRMPIRLIEPRDVAPGTAGDTAWGLDAIGALQSKFTGAGAVVAILDTGIKAGHPAFSGIEIVQEDFTGEGNGDWHGHGTHCAGTILGRDVDGTRIGVAPGVTKLLVGKVIGEKSADSTMLFDAIDWAVRAGADVISMSLGIDFPGYVSRRILIDKMPTEAAVSDALEAYRNNLRMLDAIMGMIHVGGNYGRDAVVVAAAGNESMRPRYKIAASIPGAALDVVAVAAMQPDPAGGYGVTSFSNSLPQLAAPGLEILSADAKTDKLIKMSGTSMACPHVAGVAALLWEALTKEGLEPTGANIKARLLATAKRDKIVAGTTGTDIGQGMVAAP